MSADVIANLHGGLGNQFFQLAATLHACRVTGGSTYDLLLQEGRRTGPGLADFVGVETRVPTRMDRARWTEYAQVRSPLRAVFRPTARLHERLTRRTLVKQSSPFAGAPRLPENRPVKLDGYFQHPDWFMDSWPDVVGLLLAAAPPGFEELRSRRRAVVHVRRRDYIPAGWVLGPQYYRVAMAALGVGDCDLTLVSDEPSFVEWFDHAMRPLGCRVSAAERLSGDAVVDDFWNVAAASTVILANSTYSWWAAAVATALDPTVRVVYPTPWIVNRWSRVALPELGLPGWTTAPSGLPAFG